MRLEMTRGVSNVVRFPVERRAAPTLELLRDLAPDPREIQQVIEAFDLDCPMDELRAAADRAMAEQIARDAPAELGTGRRAALAALLHPFLRRAFAVCRQAHDAVEEAATAQERLVMAQAEGGYWMAPLEDRATASTETAARLLVDAYAASEEAEGAARAVAFALRSEAWRPSDLRADAQALFFGKERHAAGF